MSRKSNNSALIAAALQNHITTRMNEDLFNPFLNNIERTIKYKKPIRRAVVNTGLKLNLKNNMKEKKRDYIITDSRFQKPSLAESMGLIISRSTLTEDEWNKQRLLSDNRGTFNQPCPICHEDFKTNSTVLLSCSHVFHRKCIESLENFTKKRSCPICRKINYEKMVTFRAEQHYIENCAIKIQAFWRGYKFCKKYSQYKDTHPPLNQHLKVKWLQQKVTQVTDKYLKIIDSAEIETFIKDLDTTVEISKKAFQEWDNLQDRILFESNDVWIKCLVKAKERNNLECSICLQTWSKGRHRVLSNCGHIFHKLCLLTFEMLSEKEDNKSKICPMCRNNYLRRDINDIHYIYIS